MASLAFRFYQIQFRSRSLRRFPGIQTFGLQRLARSRPPCLTTFRRPCPLWAFSLPLPSVLDIGCYSCHLLLSFLWLLRKSRQISFATWRTQSFLWPLPAGLSGYLSRGLLGWPHSVLPLSHKPVGHLCCKLYCFLFLKFLKIQRRNAFTLTP